MDGWNWILVDNVDLPYLVARPNEEIMLRALCEDFKNTTNIFIIRLDLGQTRGTLTVYATCVCAHCRGLFSVWMLRIITQTEKSFYPVKIIDQNKSHSFVVNVDLLIR